MSATLLPMLTEIRDQIKRLADLAEPTHLIMEESKPTPPDALVEAARRVVENTFSSDRQGFVRIANSRIKDLMLALLPHEQADEDNMLSDPGEFPNKAEVDDGT